MRAGAYGDSLSGISMRGYTQTMYSLPSHLHTDPPHAESASLDPPRPLRQRHQLLRWPAAQTLQSKQLHPRHHSCFQSRHQQAQICTGGAKHGLSNSIDTSPAVSGRHIGGGARLLLAGLPACCLLRLTVRGCR